MLRIINIYQCISYGTLMFLFCSNFSDVMESNVSLNDTVIFFCLFGLCAFLFYTNIYLYKNKKKFKSTYIKINVYVNLLQIITISVLGFSYDFVLGPRVMPYLGYQQTIDIRFLFNIIISRFSLFYTTSTGIFVGINIVPLIIFFILLKEYDKFLVNAKSK
jgi:hypothetical protein